MLEGQVAIVTGAGRGIGAAIAARLEAGGVPGQTVEDVCLAEAQFVAKVAELHPLAEGKPCLIGNCQAGWAMMALNATAPSSRDWPLV